MKNTLARLWSGELAPCSERESCYGEVRRLCQHLDRHHNDILEQLNGEGKASLEKFENCHSELNSIEREDAFIKGFSLGARLVAEALIGE